MEEIKRKAYEDNINKAYDTNEKETKYVPVPKIKKKKNEDKRGKNL